MIYRTIKNNNNSWENMVTGNNPKVQIMETNVMGEKKESSK